MIPLKSEAELQILREAGSILARIMQRLRENIKAGIRTQDLERLTEELIEKEKVFPAFLGYKGFPANICVSVNDEVVHGIPDQRIINEGDIVSLDLGIKHKGFYADMAFTAGVGRVKPEAKKLMEVTKDSLEAGIKQIKLSNRVSDISCAVQKYVENHGFSVVRQFVGHGIGASLHEEPEIPNFGLPGKGEQLKQGMVFAVEPMVNIGTWECKVLDNGWTAVTADGQLSAHFEHTVAVTKSGPEILTRA